MKNIFLFLFSFTYVLTANAMDDLSASMKVSAQAMKIQNERLKIIAQNIANVSTTGTTPEEEPYKRKMLIVKNKFDTDANAEFLSKDGLTRDNSSFNLRYEPNHPAADKAGYVKYPNVNLVLENADAKEAQRTFEANLVAIDIAKTNQLKLIDALK